MRINSRKAARFMGTATLAVALGVAVVGTAGADSAQRGANSTTTIEIKGKTHRNLRFVGPETVAAGTELTIENLTSPRRVGPHTFSLVKNRLVPKDRREQNRCFGPGGICLKIAKAHEIDLKSGQIGKRSVDEGEKGWDRSFKRKINGDSFVLEEGKGETHSRVVSAEEGRTLHFICIVHPHMQGEIEVTG